MKDPHTLASNLMLFFLNSVYEITQLFRPSKFVSRPVQNDLPIFNLEEVTENEVTNIVRSLKASKAKDAHLDTNFLKTNIDSLVAPITHLVNLSIRKCTVPTQWKVAVITPIFKSGSKKDISNYRPISILPVISKVAEKWIVKSIVKHLDKGYTPLHPMQFGFRAFHSTESANCLFIEKLKCALNKAPCAMAVFLDFKKAFDSVSHQVLLSKLTHFNLSPEAIKWFTSYLSNREQCVSINGIKSPYHTCSVGVPQGSIVGPILFSLFINDLPDVCKDVHIQMYADDAVILTHGKSYAEVSTVLTSVLTSVQDWLTDSCLLLNAKKTVCMAFSKRPVVMESSNVFLGGEELELVSEFKYLGVMLDSTLTFKKHVKKVTNTIKFNLQNFKQIRPFLTVSAAKSYLQCMILSHIEYCFTNWSCTGVTTLKPIEQLYKSALKVFDRKPHSYHHCNILQRYRFLSFANFKVFKQVSIIYKTLNGLCPPPLKEFIKRKPDRGLNTRAITRGDCEVPYRVTAFGKNTLSVQGCSIWNDLPLLIRDCLSFPSFKFNLKEWLLDNQTCDHV